MGRRISHYLAIGSLFNYFILLAADTFGVKISTEQHVNVVDRRFLSFTVDPKYLFTSTERYNSKESCMASSLTPAYLRIAGPSTSHLSFQNSSILISKFDVDDKIDDTNDLGVIFKRTSKTSKRQTPEKVTVSHNQWNKFAKWAKETGFELVFALNNNEKTRSGMWDPNPALHILTVAEKTDIGDMYWQLGYECSNQSIEEYLNDLQTLRVIVETFAPGKSLSWKVVGSDVTNCLQADSKSDFKDYVTLSLEMMDALMLNGNSTSREITRMSELDRIKLLKLLSVSETPLWITEKTQRQYNELERAADWMASLGYSARNGFSVHYRELLGEELFKPTLSFYMALLFKNLVGEKVLEVDMEAPQAALFAHCTSLRHKPVPGAVTLYGANMDDEPARFAVKLTRREEGGDIMQFILGHDSNGDTVVNGRMMSHEGDIRPIIKRLRPYKTLLINLPPKSFGFWVLANTKVEACYDFKDEGKEGQFVEALEVTTENKSNKMRKRRSLPIDDFDYSNVVDISNEFSDVDDSVNEIENQELKKRMDNLNKILRNVRNIKEMETNHLEDEQLLNRFGNVRRKRQILNYNSEERGIRKIKRYLLKPMNEKRKILDKEFKRHGLIGNILQFRGKRNNTRGFKNEKAKKITKIPKNKVNKRDFKHSIEEEVASLDKNPVVNKEKVSRSRRSVVFTEKQNTLKKTNADKSVENEIEDVAENPKLWKMLNKIQKQLHQLQTETQDRNNLDYEEEKSKEAEQILVKTKVSNDGATINLSENPNHGLIKSTFENVFSVLGDLNRNLDRIWNALSILE